MKKIDFGRNDLVRDGFSARSPVTSVAAIPCHCVLLGVTALLVNGIFSFSCRYTYEQMSKKTLPVSDSSQTDSLFSSPPTASTCLWSYYMCLSICLFYNILGQSSDRSPQKLRLCFCRSIFWNEFWNIQLSKHMAENDPQNGG